MNPIAGIDLHGGQHNDHIQNILESAQLHEQAKIVRVLSNFDLLDFFKEKVIDEGCNDSVARILDFSNYSISTDSELRVLIKFKHLARNKNLSIYFMNISDDISNRIKKLQEEA